MTLTFQNIYEDYGVYKLLVSRRCKDYEAEIKTWFHDTASGTHPCSYTLYVDGKEESFQTLKEALNELKHHILMLL